MKTITVAELRQNPTEALKAVEGGETYLVTRHRSTVAKLADHRFRISRFQRAEVALVHRNHRRQVAGAEAFEAGDHDFAVDRQRAAVSGLPTIGQS